MAAWYVSSVQHNAVAQWAATHTYAVGDKVRGLAAPSDANARVWRASSITTGISGGSEPSWNRGKGSTTTDSGVTWTEVTGNSTYGWAAAHLTIINATQWWAAGDTIYVGSDHSKTITGSATFGTTSLTTRSNVVCVDVAGSVPPVAADVRTAATGGTEGSTTSTTYALDNASYLKGMTFTGGSSSSAGNITFSQSLGGNSLLEDCNLSLVGSGSGAFIDPGYDPGGAYGMTQEWRNVIVKFAAASQFIRGGAWTLKWNGGSVDSAGTAPTGGLLRPQTGGTFLLNGIDLSFLGSNYIVEASASSSFVQFRNCKLGSSYVLANTASTTLGSMRVEAVNCHSSSSNYIDEAHDTYGDLTTESTYVLDTSDGTTTYSWKIVTTSRASFASPFESIEGAIWNDVTSGNITLTWEIENGGVTLKDIDAKVDVEYLGSSSYTQSSFASTSTANILSTGSNLTTSTASWSGGLGSATKQSMAVTIAPRMKGYIYYKLKVMKASQTLYFNQKPAVS